MSSEATSTCEPGGCNGEPVPRRAAELTRIELDILHMLGRGLTNQEIAETLSAQKRTVEANIADLIHKFQARSRLELVVRAVRLGVLEIKPEAPVRRTTTHRGQTRRTASQTAPPPPL